jgi:hypothetical protein
MRIRLRPVLLLAWCNRTCARASSIGMPFLTSSKMRSCSSLLRAGMSSIAAVLSAQHESAAKQQGVFFFFFFS